MRIHRDKLPGPFRELGNTYVRDEFRRHRQGSTTSQQWALFFEEWQKYASMLAGTADLSRERGDIPEDMLHHLNEEQKQRLELLKVEAMKAGESLMGHRDGTYPSA